MLRLTVKSILGQARPDLSDQCNHVGSLSLKWKDEGVTIVGPDAGGALGKALSFPEGLYIEPTAQIL